MRFQLDCNLGKLLPTDARRKAVAKELGINHSQMKKLCADDWSNLTKANLQQLMIWAHKREKPLFEVRSNPIWSTFSEGADILFSTGNARYWDAQVDGELRPALRSEGCVVRDMGTVESIDDAKLLMMQANCVFIGSPKGNPACEHAISALYRLTSSPNQENSTPFRFAFNDPHLNRDNSIVSRATNNTKAGIYLSSKGGTEAHFRVDWRGAEHYRAFLGHGVDAGIFLVCRQPFQTMLNVTTIILAGYTGFATYSMSRDIVSGGVRIDDTALLRSRPVVRVLRAAYKKTTELDESRKAQAKGHRWFAPPWNKVPWELKNQRVSRKRTKNKAGD